MIRITVFKTDWISGYIHEYKLLISLNNTITEHHLNYYNRLSLLFSTIYSFNKNYQINQRLHFRLILLK